MGMIKKMKIILVNGTMKTPYGTGNQWETSEIDVRGDLISGKIFASGFRVWERGDNAMRKELENLLMRDTSSLKITLRHNIFNQGTVGIRVTPDSPSGGVLGSLVQKFQDQVKISLTLKGNNRNDEIDIATVEGMRIDGESFECRGVARKETLVPFQRTGWMIVNLTADISVAETLSLTHALKTSSGIGNAQKVLETGEFSDLIIRAVNGTDIKAHKSFLSVCSPVLQAMLKCGMEESQTGLIEMNDLSEEGVKAFLRFVYYEDLKQPKENMEIAYELFGTSHKYLMPDLETEMKMLLIESRNEDFDVALAFRTYMFTRNIESGVELKTKALQVLKGKWDELEKLQEYNDLIEKPSNSKTVTELLKDLGKTAPSGGTCTGNAD